MATPYIMPLGFIDRSTDEGTILYRWALATDPALAEFAIGGLPWRHPGPRRHNDVDTAQEKSHEQRTSRER